MLFKRKLKAWEYFPAINPDVAWLDGAPAPLRPLIRLRGLWISLFLSLFVSGGIIKWIEFLHINEKYEINITFLAIGILLIVSAGIGISLYYYRIYRIRIITLRNKRHKIAHAFRDYTIDAKRHHKINYKINDLQAILCGYCDSVATLIADYFGCMLNDKTTNCLIRLFVNNEDAKELSYYSFGISNNFNFNRKNEPRCSIPIDRGLPAYFLKNANASGIIAINDINQCVIDGLLAITDKDVKFSDDYKYLLVAPINGLSGDGKKALLGLLYIASKKQAFTQDICDSLCCIADVLATGLPQIVEFLYRVLVEEEVTVSEHSISGIDEAQEEAQNVFFGGYDDESSDSDDEPTEK